MFTNPERSTALPFEIAREVPTNDSVCSSFSRPVVSVRLLKSAGIVGTPVNELYCPSNSAGLFVKLL